jgi:hypothetical protein
MTRDELTNLLAELAKSAKLGTNVQMHLMNLNVGSKVFAFAHREGIALKLPPERVQVLAKAKLGTHLVMGTKTMQGWALISRKGAAEYRKELPPLLLEAHAFVAAEASKAPQKKAVAKKAVKKAAAKKSKTR